MSASSDLQSAVAALLTGFTASVGTGAATSFSLAHGLGSTTVAVGVKLAGVPLVQGVNFSVAVVDANNVTLTAIGGAPALNAWAVTISKLSAVIPIIARISKSLENDIAAAVANQGLAISVMPMTDEECDPDFPFVFITGGKIRVRIIEKVQTNQFGVDAYQIKDDVRTLLHFRPRDGGDTPALALGAMLSDPLRLARQCSQSMFENGTERVIDVIFNAVLQINAD